MPKTSNKRLDVLRDQLLSAQTQLTRDKSVALAIIITGESTAGRSEVVNSLLEWLDPKHIKVYALDHLGKAVAHAPAMLRYWLTLPARGEIAIYFQGWYDDYWSPALHSRKRFERHGARVIERIKQLESMLPRDRVRVLKLNFRVDREVQRKRIAALRAAKATRWRVTQEERWLAKHFDRARKVSDTLIAATDAPDARWHVVDGTEADARLLQAGSLLLQEMAAGRKSAAVPPSKTAWPKKARPLRKPFASAAPERIDDEAYDRELETLQGRLAVLSRKKAFAKRAVVLAFEGMDAAGKGGAIRRLTAALDARQYTVVPISAPTPEELTHPYLWRFWRRFPERGDFAIFDRSWYGRVLVERVRELTPDADWQRAYDEINEFELQLTEANVIVHKFWLAVGKDEQLRRFQERESDPLKRFKVDREDWANRRFYDAYQLAVRDMIARTSSEHAPWTIVAADDKKYARLKVLRTVREAIERALKK